MNNRISNVHGGVTIVPSARKSIHSHCNTCRSLNCSMGRHGLPKRSDKNPDHGIQEGVDEVDNIMSKMCRHASLIPNRKTDTLRRRNSLENCDTDDSEDDENILSKSSPPSFYYSDLYGSAIQNEFQRSRNETFSTNNSYSMNNSKNFNTSTDSYNNSNLHKESKDKSSSNYFFKLIIAIVVLLLAVIIYRPGTSERAEVKDVYDKLSFYNDVRNLKDKYKVTDSSLLQVRTGISTVFENQDTASFIFTYNSKNNGFNLMKFNNFIEDITATASRYLRNKSNENPPIIDNSNLSTDTVKDFMNQYQEGVTKTGVMLVKDIDSIPSQLAMAFHYYCDEYNPLVKQSAIFFTLNVANCSNDSDKKSTYEYIEKCLAKKWSTVDEEKIGPLLTRVVNIIVDVTKTF